MAPPRAYTWEDIARVLSFPDGVTIEECYKAIFGARSTAAQDPALVSRTLQAVLAHEAAGHGDEHPLRRSVLLRHECCYLLGQLGADTDSLDVKKGVFDVLLAILADADGEDEVTRHEAAEGIAAVFNHNIRPEDEAEIAEFFDGWRQRACVSLEEAATVASTDVVLAESDLFPHHHTGRKEDSDQSPSASTVSSEAPAAFPAAIEGIEADVPSEETDFLPQGEQRTTFLRRNAVLIALLRRYVHGHSPLGQTCLLAVEGLRRERARVCACQHRSYDPAIGDQTATAADVPRYASELQDEGLPLYRRYVAMFTLRNLGCLAELAAALTNDQSSPVLRHEIAFVLGQMAGLAEEEFESEEAERAHQDRCPAVRALVHSLTVRVADHPMVRHESAIALGSVGGPVGKEALRRCVDDPCAMVAESCCVALDIIAYWEAWDAEEKRIMAL